jgi:hypothetical protein
MEYDWGRVEFFFREIGFLAEANRFLEMGLSETDLVGSVIDVLRPSNLRDLFGTNRLILDAKGAKSERNYMFVLARYGIGYSGEYTQRALADNFGVSPARGYQLLHRFECRMFPRKHFRRFENSLIRYPARVRSELYYRCLEKVCEDPNDHQPDWTSI